MKAEFPNTWMSFLEIVPPPFGELRGASHRKSAKIRKPVSPALEAPVRERPRKPRGGMNTDKAGGLRVAVAAVRPLPSTSARPALTAAGATMVAAPRPKPQATRTAGTIHSMVPGRMAPPPAIPRTPLKKQRVGAAPGRAAAAGERPALHFNAADNRARTEKAPPSRRRVSSDRRVQRGCRAARLRCAALPTRGAKCFGVGSARAARSPPRR